MADGQSWRVAGVPVPFAAGDPERLWRRALAAQLPVGDVAGMTDADEVSLSFSLGPSTQLGRDLDNLIDPVLSVVCGQLGWFRARRPTLRRIAARKAPASETGLVLSNVADPHPPGDVHFRGRYTGNWPSSGRDLVISDWVQEHGATPIPPGDVWLCLRFESATVNLGDIATGVTKKIVDGLWPLLGGSPGRPDDHRIAWLLLEKGEGTDRRRGGDVDIAAGLVTVPPHSLDLE